LKDQMYSKAPDATISNWKFKGYEDHDL